MNTHKRLTQLLAGDLDQWEADELRLQLAEDPALRTTWVEILQLEVNLLTRSDSPTTQRPCSTRPSAYTAVGLGACFGIAAALLLSVGVWLNAAPAPAFQTALQHPSFRTSLELEAKVERLAVENERLRAQLAQFRTP